MNKKRYWTQEEDRIVFEKGEDAVGVIDRSAKAIKARIKLLKEKYNPFMIDESKANEEKLKDLPTSALEVISARNTPAGWMAQNILIERKSNIMDDDIFNDNKCDYDIIYRNETGNNEDDYD